MKKLKLLSKLSLTGIINNKKLYYPYILTNILIVGMLYIMAFLSQSGILANFPSSAALSSIMILGFFVVSIFAWFFMLYTNSFIVKKRMTEFGLYNVLGLNKNDISVLSFFEAILVWWSSVCIGLFMGILFSKLCEMLLIKIMHSVRDYNFSFSVSSIRLALIIYTFISVFVLIKTVIFVHKTDAINLIKNKSYGERAPKANWVFAVTGAALLSAAYYISVTTQNPVKVIIKFFIAVIMVIVATYLLFIAGSVVLCRVLKLNKKYYYEPQNFISVSTMSFRMKRNGAGLATICILLTMILVMITGSSCLYFGVEESLDAIYPRELSARLVGTEQMCDFIDELEKDIQSSLDDAGIQIKNNISYKCTSLYGHYDGEYFVYDINAAAAYKKNDYDNIINLIIVPLEYYNSNTNQNITLNENEALIFSEKYKNIKDKIVIDEVTISVNGKAKDFDVYGKRGQLASSVFVIVNNFDQLVNQLGFEYQCIWGADFASDKADYSQANEILQSVVRKCRNDENRTDIISYFRTECSPLESYDFYTTYGCLFFLGLMLTVVFMTGTVVIMYYKQISEGYEDSKRFEIMKNIGMTDKDIRHCIDSQILIVFLTPIRFAVMHLCFAFPAIQKLLLLFALDNAGFLVLVATGTVMLFTIIYAFVYKLTSNTYYNIVNGASVNI